MGTRLLMAAVVGVLLMTGCSKDGGEKEESMEFTIDTKQISLIVGEEQKITASGEFTARSMNENVATVSADGIVTALAEGDTNIIFSSKEDASQQQTCHVRADWRYHYFEEPVLNFGATKDEIKKGETHDLKRERDNYLVYDYPGEEMNLAVSYMFDSTVGLTRIVLGVGSNGRVKKMSWGDNILNQLTERYGKPTGPDGLRIFLSREENYRVLFYYPTDITYTSEME